MARCNGEQRYSQGVIAKVEATVILHARTLGQMFKKEHNDLYHYHVHYDDGLFRAASAALGWMGGLSGRLGRDAATAAAAMCGWQTCGCLPRMHLCRATTPPVSPRPPVAVGRTRPQRGPRAEGADPGR